MASPTYTLAAAIAALQALMLANHSGLKAAPDYPPEQIDVFPFAVAYPGPATYTIQSSGLLKTVADIVLEIHVSRENLPLAVTDVIGYSDTVAVMLRDNPTISSTVDTISGAISSTFGPLNWGGVNTIGYRFSVPVKMMQG